MDCAELENHTCGWIVAWAYLVHANRGIHALNDLNNIREISTLGVAWEEQALDGLHGLLRSLADDMIKKVCKGVRDNLQNILCHYVREELTHAFQNRCIPLHLALEIRTQSGESNHAGIAQDDMEGILVIGLTSLVLIDVDGHAKLLDLVDRPGKLATIVDP
jgi:hypothetical protein